MEGILRAMGTRRVVSLLEARWRSLVTIRRAVVVLLAVSLIVPPASNAAGACSGSPGDYFDGFDTREYETWGSKGVHHDPRR